MTRTQSEAKIETKSRWFWRIIPKWTAFQVEKDGRSPRWDWFSTWWWLRIFECGYNIQTIYIYRMHVYAYTIWIHNDSHTVYIYLANVLIAQKVFREVGLKCPLSVSSIYKCWSTAKHPFVLVKGQVFLIIVPGWKQILTHYSQGSNKLLQSSAVQPFNAMTDTSPTHSFSTTRGWNLNRS